MIYFIQDTGSGTIKIGVSKKPVERLNALQTAHASPLVLLAVMDGDETAEQMLHRNFKRINGEWFEPSKDLLGYIRKHATAIQHVSIVKPEQVRPGPLELFFMWMSQRHASKSTPKPIRTKRQIDPPVRNEGFEQILEWLKHNTLTDEQFVGILALVKRADGSYLFSSEDKIAELVYGKRVDLATINVVKARVATLRPKPLAPKPTPSIRRPQNGW